MNVPYYLGEEGDHENVIIVYENPLNEEQMPSKIVVKSTLYGGHFCEIEPATYLFSPVGD